MMSCTLNVISAIKDLPTVRQFINPSGSSVSDKGFEENDGWNDDDWGWDTEEQTVDSDSNQQNKDDTEAEDWLADCEVSISPLSDLIVVSKDDRLVVLQVSYEDQDDGMLSVLWKRVLSEFPREEITCVYCLPLISYKKSSQGTADWTCIIVGFNTGHIRMYTETGTKVLDQMIHNESVVSIKCKTYSQPRYTYSTDLTEELSILYETALVTLDGFGLFQTLRACKNQAAMAAATGSRTPELPPLGYKKWGLKNQGEACDHCSAGSYTPNPFDQMQTASFAGFDKKISPVPPTSYIYGVCGDNPYMGLYYVKEGDTTPLFNNVTDAATKLLSVGASALLSWGSSFLGKKAAPEPTEKPQHKIEPATHAYPRYQLFDKRRIGQTMTLSPFGKNAAVTDTLGRVLLIDTHTGVIKRVWKGYRNAQVGWMHVKEPKTSSHIIQRHALFLLIYAPKRGLLEIWLAENGPRVGAFNVGKGCRLLYPGCKLLGLNGSTYKYIKGKTTQSFLLKACGTLMDITIPFHLSLSDSNSKRAHDHQLLKMLKSILRDQTDDNDELTSKLWEPISKLKMISSCQVALDKLLGTPYITSLTSLNIIKKIISSIKRLAKQQAAFEQDDDEDKPLQLDVESRLLIEFASHKKQLIEMYEKLVNLSQADRPQDEKSIELQPVEETQQLLSLNLPVQRTKKVAFNSQTHILSLSEFLSYIDCGSHSTPTLRPLSKDQTVLLGELLFKPCIESGVILSALTKVISTLQLSPRSLLDLLLSYYMSLLHPSADNLPALLIVIEELYLLDNSNANSSNSPDNNAQNSSKSEPSTPLSANVDGMSGSYFDSRQPTHLTVPWWKHIRDTCEASDNLNSYLHIAIVCRSICLKQTEESTSKMDISEDQGDDTKEPTVSQSEDATSSTDQVESDDSNLDTWENLSMDVAMWNVSVKHIEDVAVLNRFLQWQPNNQSNAAGSGLKFVSVKDFKLAKRGFVGEMVGKWCVANKMSQADLSRFLELSSSSVDNNADAFIQLRLTFPLSLTSDCIFTNTAWEYASLWNKDLESLSNLKLSFDYLEVIENGCLRHGICWMMWRVYLIKRLSSLVTLMEKVGKSPKDRLCKKELDLDTAATTEMMSLICHFMIIFLQANCDFSEPHMMQCEPNWEDYLTGHSLVDMANQQRETNYQLLNLHASLVTIVSAVLVFSMKSVKVMTLFDHNAVSSFFKELNSHPYLGSEGKNEIISSNRRSFLRRVIKHSVQSLPERSSLITAPGVVTIDKNHDGMRWPLIVLELGEKFKLDTDCLRQYHVKELISHGYDELAIELIPTISNPEPVCADVLELCAQRIVYVIFIAEQEETANISSSASPSLLEWLSQKDYSQLAELSMPAASTNKLLLYILKGLKSSPLNYRYADELYNLTSNISVK